MSPKQLTTAFIENVRPALDSGRYPIKRIVGEPLVVEADVLKDGHDITVALLKWRCEGEKNWRETSMEHLGGDHWRAVCAFDGIGLGEFTIEVYTERWLTWGYEFTKKYEAGINALALEIEEGARLIDGAVQRAKKSADAPRLREFATTLRNATSGEARALADSPELLVLMTAWADRALAHEMTPHSVRVDREAARFGAWYEFFPRSAEGHADRGSTFRDCLPRIDAAKAMGFDTIYFPPIHPIGFKNRKGRNNSTKCEPGDPGVPYAIGAPSGGHYAIEPALGTMKDFEWLLKELKKREMELVLDFAINCSPDHPYVEEHPDWFHSRPDGSIKFAENPPKKYEDIYPLNWTCDDWKALWSEMRDILLFWSGKGVRIFRVDNPHTKPLAMWEFIITSVQREFPDVIFLSEAFTRPKLMQALAKVGFTQSYTYFTWRTSKWELTQYFEELTQSEVKEYMRGNLFPNTPDILPWHLQRAPRNTFLHRFAMTATLSPIYGMYSGFELCENEPFPGKEEYWESEKYHYQGRDWNAPGNIIDWVTCLNGIRRSERALQLYDNLRFHRADNDSILFYSKVTPARDSRLLIAVNLDSNNYQGCQVEVPLEYLGLNEHEPYFVRDLITGDRFEWRGRMNYIGLRPDCPAHVLRVES